MKISKKVFISIPMNGKDDQLVKKEMLRCYKDAVSLISDQYSDNDIINVKLIDSFIDNAPKDASPLWYLSKSLEMMADADYVYFAPEWKTTRGCKCEHICAEEYGLKILKD